MKRTLGLLFTLTLGVGALAAYAGSSPRPFPYAAAGLAPQEAAAHLLDRFTFGARPGEPERVVAEGLEVWFERQLSAALPEPALPGALEPFPSLKLSARELHQRYPRPVRVLAMAVEEGVVSRPEAGRAAAEDATPEQRRAVLRFAQAQGFGQQKDLLAELTGQKLVRAVVAENQLHEVLTDFWYNHFYVSTADPEARVLALPYERDAIRPRALGRFRDLLGASARHPAMLLYLDNAGSSANPGAITTFRPREGRAGGRRSAPRGPRQGSTGLNENYARELLELHTLGVDGGYTQEDVVNTARAFTGWTVMPSGERGQQLLARLDARARQVGFVKDGDFLFRADRHDAGAKTVLGTRLAAGRGIEDGEELLDLFAAHPATARHIATKLAVRFVADEPPAALVERLAQVFRDSRGDTRTLLRELVAAPEFWAARRGKVKSPFELTASALRWSGARLYDPRPVVAVIADMGQPLYAHGAPTGPAETATGWVNAGSMVERMNFVTRLAADRLPGAQVDPNTPQAAQLTAPHFQRR